MGSSGEWMSAQVDTDSSSRTTGNGTQIRQATTSTHPLTLTIIPSASPLPSRPASGSPADPTYGTQVKVDELSDNNVKSVYLPSDATDVASHLPPLVSVRHPSQSQPNVQAQSATISPSNAQSTSTPIRRTTMPANSTIPKMHYQSLDSNSTQMFPSYTLQPLRESAPNTHPIYPGTPSQQYRHQSPMEPQSYSSGPTGPFIPPQFHSKIPSAPAPLAIHAETTQPFISQTPGPKFDDVPFPQPSPTQAAKLRTSRRDTFVIRDPFQVSRDDDKACSDDPTYHHISGAVSAPGTQLSQGIVTGPCGSLPRKPTFEGNLSNTKPPGTYGQGYISTEPEIYSPSIVVNPRDPRRPSLVPEPPIQLQKLPHMPSIPPNLEGETSGQEERSIAQMPPTLPTPEFEPQVQSQAPVFSESPMPSIQHSPTIEPKPHNIVTPIYSDISWRERQLTKFCLDFMLVTLPRQAYLLMLFRLPSLYFSRVAWIFEEADMSLAEIKNMVLQESLHVPHHGFEMHMPFESSVSPAHTKLTSSWGFFIDSVIEEWKTFNVVSALLLTAVLTMLQIQSAAADPLTRYTALFSLLFALISLIFGCMFVVLFSSMRRIHRAGEWALEARRTETFLWWNVWILLATPAIWLIWSIILYIACIMSFVWRSGVTNTTTPTGVSDTTLLAIRVVFTVVLGIGVLNVFLTVTTFRQSRRQDRAWKQRIDNWMEERAAFTLPTMYPPMSNTSSDGLTVHQPSAIRSSLHHQLSFGDTQGGYAQNTYGPTYASDTYGPPPESYSTPSGKPHSPLSADNVTQANTILNQSHNRRHDDTSAGYTPSAGTTPLPLPNSLINSVEGTAPILVPNESYYLGVHPPHLPHIPDAPVAGSSSGREIRVGGDVLDNEHRVRFRSPLIPDQGSINLVHDMSAEVT